MSQGVDPFLVQQYVANYLNAQGIFGLDQVWPARPNVDDLNFADFGSGPMRCQGIVYVEGDDEVRRAFGASRDGVEPGHGMKWLAYQVRVEFCHRSADEDWIAADQAFKQVILGGVTAAIRKDGALGTGNLPQPLFRSAGEGRTGIKRVYEAPFTDPATGSREQWAYVQFTVNGWVTG